MPADAQARTSLVTEILAWVIAAAGKAELAALALYRGTAPEGWLWDAHDGLPGVLILSRDEFAELQEHWHRRGFPRDLFYPASRRPRVIEPVARYGGSSGGTGTTHRVSGHTVRRPAPAPCKYPQRATEPGNSLMRVTASSWPYCFGSRSPQSPDANTKSTTRRRRRDLGACARRGYAQHIRTSGRGRAAGPRREGRPHPLAPSPRRRGGTTAVAVRLGGAARPAAAPSGEGTSGAGRPGWRMAASACPEFN
jgi:hypothetical protein